MHPVSNFFFRLAVYLLFWIAFYCERVAEGHFGAWSLVTFCLALFVTAPR